MYALNQESIFSSFTTHSVNGNSTYYIHGVTIHTQVLDTGKHVNELVSYDSLKDLSIYLICEFARTSYLRVLFLAKIAISLWFTEMSCNNLHSSNSFNVCIDFYRRTQITK